jgi:hypothetical protein
VRRAIALIKGVLYPVQKEGEGLLWRPIRGITVLGKMRFLEFIPGALMLYLVVSDINDESTVTIIGRLGDS